MSKGKWIDLGSDRTFPVPQRSILAKVQKNVDSVSIQSHTLRGWPLLIRLIQYV